MSPKVIKGLCRRTSKSVYHSVCRCHSVCWIIFLITFAFCYSVLQVNGGWSIYNEGEGRVIPSYPFTRKRLKAVRIQLTHIGNVGGGGDISFHDGNKDNEIQLKYIEAGLNKTRAITPESTVTKEPKIILIIAYMRTGSTLTGAIFQSYSGTFYVFEPIRNLQSFFRNMTLNGDKQGVVRFANGTLRIVTRSERKNIILDEISNWLSCKLTSLSINDLSDIHHSQRTNIMGELISCIKEQGKIQEGDTDSCFDQAKHLCKTAPLRIIKFIRLRMEDAAKLLPRYPNMKLIHLLRDPRGIMNSRFQIGEAHEAEIKTEANMHCTKVANDLKTSKEIMSKFPGRLKIVLYEDLAENPLETSKSMFEFSGLPFTDFVQAFIKNQTNADHDADNYETQRKNSSFTANNWRNRMKSNVSNIVYKACWNSNKILGYLPLWSNKDLRDQRISSRLQRNVTKQLLESRL